ncbi:MAG TPA: SGNH/GDSL hydrolase family protein [Candidatus Solibacter sp.]|jgi:hypothetical protein|nr:SGNH/GDSL hydrolase family protein [Candidatus Solibacter sp.]
MANGLRRVSACAFVVAMIGIAGCGSTSTTAAQSNLGRQSPSTAPSQLRGVIALGHSGLTGFKSVPQSSGDARQNSWATGTATEVDSVYQRLVALSPETAGHVANAARDGATADTLSDQARVALSQVPMPQLVVIQTIDNDIRCDGTDSAHVGVFGASVAKALDVITKASPKSAILLVSQPGRPATVAATVAKVPEAKAAFTGTGMCDFFDPAGMTNAQHIATVTALVMAYEAEQNRVCALVPQCSGDHGVFAGYVDDVNDLAQGDWNHLTAHGHARLAAAIWPTVARLLTLG